jgi:cyclophilin family peptidyl-prolyl cis-trans isomerase/HEAT repeat protein
MPDVKPNLLRRRMLGVAVIAGALVLLSCEKMEQRYIKQDKLFRIAKIEDCRANDTMLTSMEILADPDPEIRAAAAVAIARIGDEYYRQALKTCLYDSVPEAAKAKFFAAGLTGDSGFVDTLLALAALNIPARERAIEAAGRLADSSRAAELAVFLNDDDTLVIYQALLALWRSKGWSQADKMAEIGLSDSNRKVRYGALYALSRGGRIEGRPLFRRLMADTDPEFRLLACLGLGRSVDTASIDIVATGLNDADSRVVAAAIYALMSFGKTGTGYIGRKLPELSDEKLVTLAIQAIGDNPYKGSEKVVERIFRSDSRENVRSAAAEALLQINGMKALFIIDELLTPPTIRQKVQIAEGLVGIDQTAAIARLGQLLNDSIPVVRVAALEALGRVDSVSAEKYARKGLRDGDYTIIVTAIDLAARYNLTDLIPDIAGIYLEQRDSINDDLKTAVIDAWGRFAADSTRDSLIIAALEEGCNDESYLIRKKAARVLQDRYNIDRSGQVGLARTGIEKRNYRDLFQRYDANPTAVMETPRGEITIELLYDDAPKTVNNFVSLVEKGFYNNRVFHRVIPNFVIQDGCPRGDGWGGPGYTIRCEYNLLSYTTGMVGMALSGRDTGGSQYFITLSPQPHLDARYTIFGRVISGMDVARRIVRGDSIRNITIQYGNRGEK